MVLTFVEERKVSAAIDIVAISLLIFSGFYWLIYFLKKLKKNAPG